jgi:voltage-gated potassium channel
MNRFRHRLHEIIFEADTRAGRIFDVSLIWLVLTSVALVMLDSVSWIHDRYPRELFLAEWAFTVLFTIEYILRLIAVQKPLRYVFSFFGLIDLIAIVPTYMSVLLPGAQSLLVIRTFRLLRVFRIFKLGQYLGEAQMLYGALRASRAKISVFLLTVAAVVVTMGALMYIVEGADSGFTSIPMGMYWAVVTMTTVGYGDIVPRTTLGQTLASGLMILGYGIIAVPTGIVTTELARASRLTHISGQACPSCGIEAHDADAEFCKRCGSKL